MKALDVETAQRLARTYFDRRAKWNDEEDEMTSFMVAVLNFGDHLTAVHCLSGEWSGTKADLTPRQGIPRCPNGHALLESGTQHRLALVEQPTPNFNPATGAAVRMTLVEVGVQWCVSHDAAASASERSCGTVRNVHIPCDLRPLVYREQP